MGRARDHRSFASRSRSLSGVTFRVSSPSAWPSRGLVHKFVSRRPFVRGAEADAPLCEFRSPVFSASRLVSFLLTTAFVSRRIYTSIVRASRWVDW